MSRLIKRCFCGCDEYEEAHDDCVGCDWYDETGGGKNKLTLDRCLGCGTVRQQVDMEPEEYRKMYEDSYHDVLHHHSFEHDFEIAKLRTEAYGMNGTTKGHVLLDVGSGNGAFVSHCRSIGMDAWGVEVCQDVGDDRYTYRGTLAEQHFPTDFADHITLHDVLEHIVDPRAFLDECHRIMKPGGKLVVDVPDFYGPDGVVHWRPTQHLWYPKVDQLVEWLRSCGFQGERVYKPTEAKIVVVVHAVKDVTERPRLILFPGIGDIYWVMVKLKGILDEKFGSKLPDVSIAEFDGRNRSEEFVSSFPFVHAAGYVKTRTPKEDLTMRELYMDEGRRIYRTDAGVVLSYNGVLRNGWSLDEIDPDWIPRWFTPTFRPLTYELKASSLGDYVVGSFSGHGMFKHWVRQMRPNVVADVLREVHELTRLPILLLGCEWDADFNASVESMMRTRYGTGWYENMTGDTSFWEMNAIVSNATACLGWCSGLTILAAARRVPTIIFWHPYFKDHRFWWNACPTPSHRSWYRPMGTFEGRPEKVSAVLEGLL